MVPTIRVTGAFATLTGITNAHEHLKDCLSFLHPGRFHNLAFKQKRWDGRVALSKGNRFPAGFVRRVRSHLRDMDYRVKVRSSGSSPIDSSPVDRDYLNGIKLWDHQLQAIRTILENPRCVLKSPTGSGKTAILAAAARMFWEDRGWRSLIIVPKRGLAMQTAARFREFYDEELSVGVVGDGLREIEPITIATAQSLIHFKPFTTYNRKTRKKRLNKGDDELRDLIADTDVLFIDECHRTRSASWRTISEACPARRRYGVSGTPLVDRQLDDMILEGVCGPVMHMTDATDLMDKGLVARPKIVMLAAENASETLPRTVTQDRFGKLRMRDPAYRDAYGLAIVHSVRHNDAVVMSVLWLLRAKRRVLVLCRMKEHFIALSERLADAGVEAICLWGDTPTDERQDAKDQFASGNVRCLLATTIFDEGEDVSGINAIVLAEGVQANTSALQRIGRGMRKDSKDVWVVDIVPAGNDRLIEHGARRAEIYEREGYDVVVQEDWPKRFSLRPPVDLLPFRDWSRVSPG